MPFDNSGNFNRVRGGADTWKQDAQANVKIRADYHDDNDNDLAGGLSNTICKDGQTTITQNIPFNTKRITNLANPVNPQDAATKASSEAYANAIRDFNTSLTLTGNHTNGRIKFTGTQVTGLEFSSGPMFFGAVSSSGGFFRMNDAADGTGSDFLQVFRSGRLRFPMVAPAVTGIEFFGTAMSIMSRTVGVPAGTQRRLAINTAVDGTGTDSAIFNGDGSIDFTTECEFQVPMVISGNSTSGRIRFTGANNTGIEFTAGPMCLKASSGGFFQFNDAADGTGNDFLQIFRNNQIRLPAITGTPLLGYSIAGMSLVGRLAGAPAGSTRRLVLNNAGDGTGTDTLLLMATGAIGWDTGGMSIVPSASGAGGGSLLVRNDVNGAGTTVLAINKDGSLSGSAVDAQYFKNFIDRSYWASTTWTKPAGLKYLEVWVQGGGGGGGGAQAAANNAAVGGGGGGGGGTYKLFAAADLAASVAVTAGSFGAGGVAANGTGANGGTSSFSASLTASGGTGGSATGDGNGFWPAIGGAHGVGSGGDVDYFGSGGVWGMRFGGSTVTSVPGPGGVAGLGGGGGYTRGSSGTAGVDVNLVNKSGGGGGGAYSRNADGGVRGGNGGMGWIRVREWY